MIENYLIGIYPEIRDHFVLCDITNNHDPERLTVELCYLPRGEEWRYIRATL